MARRILQMTLLYLCCTVSFPAPAQAQWAPDGIPVAPGSANQDQHALISGVGTGRHVGVTGVDSILPLQELHAPVPGAAEDRSPDHDAAVALTSEIPCATDAAELWSAASSADASRSRSPLRKCSCYSLFLTPGY